MITQQKNTCTDTDTRDRKYFGWFFGFLNTTNEIILSFTSSDANWLKLNERLIDRTANGVNGIYKVIAMVNATV